MKLIDFDDRFSAFLREWLEENSDRYQEYAQVEALMPELYQRFLHTPAGWLGGALPCDYFAGYPDPQSLVSLIADYLDAGVPIPDLLLETIEGLGAKAEIPLFRMLQDGAADMEARMLCIHLLSEMGSRLPLQLYILWQLRREERDELADRALEALEEMGEEAVLPMLEALPEANETGREALLTILSHYPEYKEVYDALVRLFDACPERQAVLAACLGRLGDARALPVLIERAEEEGLKYLDYIELRAAIEALGGEAPGRRFEEDPEYEALRGMM